MELGDLYVASWSSTVVVIEGKEGSNRYPYQKPGGFTVQRRQPYSEERCKRRNRSNKCRPISHATVTWPDTTPVMRNWRTSCLQRPLTMTAITRNLPSFIKDLGTSIIGKVALFLKSLTSLLTLNHAHIGMLHVAGRRSSHHQCKMSKILAFERVRNWCCSWRFDCEGSPDYS